MSKMATNSGLSGSDLRRKLTDAGYGGTLVLAQKQEELVTGQLTFDTLPSGIRIHCSDTVEQRTASCTVTLDARLSIIVLLQGKVRYCLNGFEHQFESSIHPVLFMNVISEGEVFTRHLEAGQKVQKINISVPFTSLLARCRSLESKTRLERLFSRGTQVIPFDCAGQCCADAREILNLEGEQDLGSELQREQLALRLLSGALSCLPPDLHLERRLPINVAEAMMAKSQVCGGTAIKSDAVQLANKAKSLIDEQDSSLSVAQLAEKLSTSVSTLQRHFKKVHKVSVAEYQRQQKLRYAKQAIVNGQLSIGEAAFLAGYQHVGNFITAFKKTYNICPAEMRKQHLN